ncbi:MAG: hypothetical protein ACK5K7_02995 [Bacilli bacterium]
MKMVKFKINIYSDYIMNCEWKKEVTKYIQSTMNTIDRELSVNFVGNVADVQFQLSNRTYLFKLHFNDVSFQDVIESERERGVNVYNYYCLKYPSQYRNIELDYNNLAIGEVKCDKTQKFLKFIIDKSSYINEVDKVRLDRSLYSAKNFKHHVMYVGKTKFLDLTSGSKYYVDTNIRYICAIMYLRALDYMLEKYYSVEFIERYKYLFEIMNVYNPQTIYDEGEVDKNYIGLSGFTRFNQSIYEIMKNVFQVDNKIRDIARDAENRYFFNASESAKKLNGRVLILTVITVMISLLSLLSSILLR